MLNLVDSLIQKVLDTQWTATPPPVKPYFSFATPDAEFRSHLPSDKPTLNMFLTEIKENRDFRRASWDTIPLPDRTTVLSMPPAYFDCLYLVSAWSPAQDSPMVSPAMQEHQTLGEALRVFIRNPDLVPNSLGITGGVVFTNAHIYFTVGPPEAARMANELWQTMQLPWKATVSLIVTAPVDPLFDAAPSPLMVTFVQRFGGVNSAPADFEELIQIGGWVLKKADDSPIANATVTRVDTGEQTMTDVLGQFTFTGLHRGMQTFSAAAAGMSTLEKTINIPVASADDHIFRLS